MRFWFVSAVYKSECIWLSIFNKEKKTPKQVFFNQIPTHKHLLTMAYFGYSALGLGYGYGAAYGYGYAAPYYGAYGFF